MGEIGNDEYKRLFEETYSALMHKKRSGAIDTRLPAVLYLESIADVVSKVRETTYAGFVNVISLYIQYICERTKDSSIISACTLFRAFLIKKTAAYIDRRGQLQSYFRNKATDFLKICNSSRANIAARMLPYVTDGCKIAMLGFSRCIEASLRAAIENGRLFTVYIILTRGDIPCCAKLDEFVGYLKQKDIPVIVVPLDNVLHCVRRVDFVVTGSLAITQNGGSINSTGTAITAMVAKQLKKPFYILCEFLKFNKLYVLNDLDLPYGIGPTEGVLNVHGAYLDIVRKHDIDLCDDDSDYTPPECIDLIITDSGVHTPQSAADELANAYLL